MKTVKKDILFTGEMVIYNKSLKKWEYISLSLDADSYSQLVSLAHKYKKDYYPSHKAKLINVTQYVDCIYRIEQIKL